MRIFLATILFSISLQLSAQTKDEESEAVPEKNAERMIVKGKRIRGQKTRQSSSTKQSESLDSESLKKYGAHSLADAISQASGVNTQTFCANCGAKRITIDGLRGEHTTILIDDFPMHSTVSAFYGVDAIPVSGISSVEVNRGAGNALLSPESIGGSINIKTMDPLSNKIEVYTEKGSHGSSLSSGMASIKTDDTGIIITGQRSVFESWDIDHNKIGESPYRANDALSLKINQKLPNGTDLSFRHSFSHLEIIGGNTQRFKPLSYTRIQAQPSDFIDNDVTKEYLGDLNRITDVIGLTRKESALSLNHELANEAFLNLKISRVDQMQDAEYSHGYDYRNKDRIDFISGSLEKIVGDHTFTLLLENRSQAMNSKSDALYVERQRPLTPDSLTYKGQSIGLLDQWDMTDSLSLDLAARFDQINVQWIDLKHEVKETVISPKINAKYLHTEHLSSQLSLGRGYRPPLTLFESEHGSDHDGFLVEIDKIEKSESAIYSLSANYPTWFLTGTYHFTRLRHMAYAEDHVVKGMPLVFKNSDEDYDIKVFDIFTGMEILDRFRVQASYENFAYEDSYTEKLPAAAIEQRFVLDADFDAKPIDLGLQLTWIGARDLRRYGYDEHYKKYDLEVSSPTFGQVSDPKNLNAPAFWYANFHSKWDFSKNYAFVFRVNNVFDYTQTGDGDSPTTWHFHVNHAHFDNFHTWGPLTGREYFVGIEGHW